MTGFVIKDILVLKKTIRSYALFLALYSGLALTGVFSIALVVGMIEVMVMMLPVSAFSYDQWAKWDRFALSSPLSRRQVVGARYLFTLLVALGAAAVGALTCVLLSLLSTPASEENPATVTACLAVGLLIADILLPLCYKLGPERARPYLYAVVFLPALLFWGAFRLGLLDGLDLSSVSPAAVMVVCLLFLLAALAGLVPSYLVSCRIMEQKEF